MKYLTATLLLFCLVTGIGNAREPYVPDELRAWQEWVLDGEEHRECPMFFNRQPGRDAFVCSWAEPLQLMVNARGGRFDLRANAYAETWITLPGDTQNHPQEVTLNNLPVVVQERQGVPALLVPKGLHRIAGRFSWTVRPETLGMPPELALIELNVDGRVINNPERQGNRLWLGERRQASEQPERLDIRVNRLLSDGIPMMLNTRIKLAVSGAAREELLGVALPTGFVPVALDSALPARLEPDGRLRIQLRPGYWEVALVARATSIIDRLVLDDPGEPWAESEIWSYLADPRLRVSNPTAAVAVDPGQVEVPDQWRLFPAFSLAPGEALAIEERSRGMSEQDKSRLSVVRAMWLDFAGDAMTNRDTFSGEMRQNWRLDMQPPYALLSARQNDEDLLVTQGREPGQSGVELRSPGVSVATTSRVEFHGSLLVSGWTETLDSMRATLHLPPGYRLMTTTGVDRSWGSWTSRWKLLDFFLVLVIAVGTRRLLGNVAGAVALLALAMTYHEVAAPVWSWLNLLIAVALAGVVTKGQLGRATNWYRNASYLVVLVLLVPFVANQLRLSLFPQLEVQAAQYAPSQAMVGAVEEFDSQQDVRTRKSRPSHETRADTPMAAVGQALEEVTVTASRVRSGALYTRYDPDALVQTGPGLPGWQWQAVQLGWNGPVEPQQSMRLVLLSPWQTAAWRVLGAILATALFLLLLRPSFDFADRLRRLRNGSAVAAALTFLLLVPMPGELQAETPPQSILDELKIRLTAPPECVPLCAVIPSARVDASSAELVIELDVHAGEKVAVPLPGQADGWQPGTFSVDGRPRTLLHRDKSGTLWLSLEPGIHRVRLIGTMPAADSFQVPFPLQPREVLASAVGWELTGIRDQRMVSGAIELTRIKRAVEQTSAMPESLTADRFPAFVRVNRVIELGLEWTVRTDVHRMSPRRGAINLEIPLLPGESVTLENVQVLDNKVAVSLAPDEHMFSWRSTLSRAPSLQLTAAADQPWSESWGIEASHIWHVAYQGTPLIMPADFPGAFWVPEFHPRAGESLSIDISRPQAVPGETLAIDRVTYLQDVGERNSTLSLNFTYRSTRGQQHGFDLPQSAELESVIIDGQPQSLRLVDGRLVVPIVPGEHTVMARWRVNQGADWVQRQAALGLGAPSSNVTLGFDLPRNRWVLATRGPMLGPAVLYWAELVVFILLAWLLGKTTITPLRTHDWLLLGLGFSTFSWGVLAMVAAWLFVMGWRRNKPDVGEPIWFNLRQLVLAVTSIGILLALVYAIPMALLGNPDMHIVGNNSSMYRLRWFSDLAEGDLPAVAVFSTPLWFYKTLILLWALWLSFALVRWLPWVWQCFRTGGYWRSPAPKAGAKPPAEVAED